MRKRIRAGSSKGDQVSSYEDHGPHGKRTRALGKGQWPSDKGQVLLERGWQILERDQRPSEKVKDPWKEDKGSFPRFVDLHKRPLVTLRGPWFSLSPRVLGLIRGRGS